MDCLERCDMEKINVIGTCIHNIRMNEAVDTFVSYLNGKEFKMVFTPNPEIVMIARDNESYRKVINSGDLVVPDGIGLIHGTFFKKCKIKYRVPGFDLLTNVLYEIKDRNYKIYLLGGKPKIAEKAAQKIEKDFKTRCF